MADKSKDTPLAELTLRRYEKPYALEDRELVRKLCLSLGLLQYGDSRDIVVDIFLVLLRHRTITLEDLETKVKLCRTSYNLPQSGIATSNIRRQVRRLKDLFLVEKFDGYYRVVENAPLAEIFEQHIERFVLTSILSRVKEYMQEVEKLRPAQPTPVEHRESSPMQIEPTSQDDVHVTPPPAGSIKRILIK